MESCELAGAACNRQRIIIKRTVSPAQGRSSGHGEYPTAHGSGASEGEAGERHFKSLITDGERDSTTGLRLMLSLRVQQISFALTYSALRHGLVRVQRTQERLQDWAPSNWSRGLEGLTFLARFEFIGFLIIFRYVSVMDNFKMRDIF